MHKRIKQSIAAAGKDVKPIVLPSSQTIAKPLVSGWVSVNDRLPEPLQTVWISGQIVTEAEEDDLDVQYWHECPAPPCR